NDKGTALTLAHVSAKLLRLPERHPDGRGIALGHSLAPEHQHVDSLIRHAVKTQRHCDAARRVLGVPRLEPRTHAHLQRGHTLPGDPLLNILLHWSSS